MVPPQRVLAIYVNRLVIIIYKFYIQDCKPQLGELDAKNLNAPAGKTAQ